MLLHFQETHSTPITQFILYLRSFNRNSFLRQRSTPRMNSWCKQREANRNSKQIRCHKLPCALPGTRVWGSRVHFSPPHPHSGSAAQHRSARFRSLLWNPWSCGSAHHCRLEKQTENTESEALTQWFAVKAPCPYPVEPDNASSWQRMVFQTQLFHPQNIRKREHCMALNSWAILGRLFGEFLPKVETHTSSLLRSPELTTLIKKTSQHRRPLS